MRLIFVGESYPGSCLLKVGYRLTFIARDIQATGPAMEKNIAVSRIKG